MAKKMNSARKKDLLFYCLLLAWPVLQFCVFYIGVNFNTVLMAFQSYDALTNTTTFVWFDNFKQFFFNLANDVMYLDAIKNSFIMWFVGLFISMPVGLLFSYYIYKAKPLGGFYHVILFLPAVISVMVLSITYQFFVDVYVPGVINKLFGTKMMGLISNLDTRFFAVVLYGVWFGFGSSTLMYLGAMKNISGSVIEAAMIDGATPMQEFILVVLPQIFSTFSVFIVTGIAGFFVNQGALFEFFATSASNKVYTFGYWFFVQTYISSEQHNYLAAIGLILTLVIAPVCAGLRKAFTKIDPMY